LRQSQYTVRWYFSYNEDKVKGLIALFWCFFNWEEKGKDTGLFIFFRNNSFIHTVQHGIDGKFLKGDVMVRQKRLIFLCESFLMRIVVLVSSFSFITYKIN
jgi:hypothetical protein